MEVATGEHGDWVHKLVMAVNKGNCGRGQSSTSSSSSSVPQNCNYNNQSKNNVKKEALEIVIGRLQYYIIELVHTYCEIEDHSS